MSIRLPKDGETVRVFSQDYTFHLAPNPENPTALGWCDCETCEIWVHPKSCEQKRRKVFLHECIESMNFEDTINLEHDQIDHLEAGFDGFMRDNPHLFK